MPGRRGGDAAPAGGAREAEEVQAVAPSTGGVGSGPLRGRHRPRGRRRLRDCGRAREEEGRRVGARWDPGAGRRLPPAPGLSATGPCLPFAFASSLQPGEVSGGRRFWGVLPPGRWEPCDASASGTSELLLWEISPGCLTTFSAPASAPLRLEGLCLRALGASSWDSPEGLVRSSPFLPAPAGARPCRRSPHP